MIDVSDLLVLESTVFKRTNFFFAFETLSWNLSFCCCRGFAKTLWLEDGLKLHASLDAEMQELYKKEEHAPLLLTWMLFNFLGPMEEDFPKYRKFGFLATKLNVFQYLERLLNEPMFKVSA